MTFVSRFGLLAVSAKGWRSEEA